MNPHERGTPVNVLAFDIGGTNLRSALVDDGGRLGARRDRPTPVGNLPALLAAIVAEAHALQADADRSPVALGIAIAGYTDTHRGLVYASPAVGLRDASLGAPLRDALGLPVRLVNDVNAAAWGEARVAGSADLVALFIGTGVGTGFVSSGTLVEGHHGMAAEGGHVIWREGGLPCPLGHAGCYEMYLGGNALGERARQAGLGADAHALVAAWRAGSGAAAAIMRDAQDAVGSLCRLLVTLMDPERIVIAGGVASRTPELLAAARAAVSPHPLSAAAGAVRVDPATLGDRAGLMGAAWLAHALVAKGMLPRDSELPPKGHGIPPA
ncbi:MAG TPA: ROK family protein [Planctomycetota bacterium]|nr:ROK family protein [Planctomycetota bacterium]